MSSEGMKRIKYTKAGRCPYVGGATKKPALVKPAEAIIEMAPALWIGAFPLKIILTAANPDVMAAAAEPSVASRSARLEPGVTGKHHATTAPPTSTVAESSQNASPSR